MDCGPSGEAAMLLKREAISRIRFAPGMPLEAAFAFLADAPLRK